MMRRGDFVPKHICALYKIWYTRLDPGIVTPETSGTISAGNNHIRQTLIAIAELCIFNNVFISIPEACEHFGIRRINISLNSIVLTQMAVYGVGTRPLESLLFERKLEEPVVKIKCVRTNHEQSKPHIPHVLPSSKNCLTHHIYGHQQCHRKFNNQWHIQIRPEDRKNRRYRYYSQETRYLGGSYLGGSSSPQTILGLQSKYTVVRRLHSWEIEAIVSDACLFAYGR